MRIYQCSGHLFTITQCKVSVIKHRCLFSFHTQLILLAGVQAERVESRDGRTAAVATDFHTSISTYSCCSCTQMRSMKLLFGSQNSKFAHNKFLVLKRHENLFLKTIWQSRFEANIKGKLPSIVVRTSFKIFHALFDVRPRMRRLSQASQIECKTWRIGVQICIKSSNNFVSEMDVNKVRYQRNWQDNYFVSETALQHKTTFCC